MTNHVNLFQLSDNTKFKTFTELIIRCVGGRCTVDRLTTWRLCSIVASYRSTRVQFNQQRLYVRGCGGHPLGHVRFLWVLLFPPGRILELGREEDMYNAYVHCVLDYIINGWKSPED
jgi:hypothetical protein